MAIYVANMEKNIEDTDTAWWQAGDHVERSLPLLQVLAGAPQLCRHTFGNFVVQHVLEHGKLGQKPADWLVGVPLGWLNTKE